MIDIIPNKLKTIIVGAILLLVLGSSAHSEERPRLVAQMGHASGILSIAFSADGRFMVTGGEDLTVRLWHTATGRELRGLEGHTGKVNSVVFSPDGRYVASGSSDHSVRLWDWRNGNQLWINEHAFHVNSVAFSSDGRYVASGGGGQLGLWDSRTSNRVRMESIPRDITAIVFSPDGRHIAFGTGGPTIYVWNWEASKQVRQFQGQTDSVYCLGFSPDGKYLASGGLYGTRLWDWETGEIIQELEGHSVYSVTFSLDSRYISSGGYYGVQLWDRKDKKKIQVLDRRFVKSATFSPDSRFLASGGTYDGIIGIWDLETGRQVRILKGNSLSVHSIALSRNSKYIASASGGVIQLWDGKTGKQIRTLGKPDSVSCVSFSRDSGYLASGGYDKTIRLWDSETGKQVWVVEGLSGPVNSVVFSPDGRYIASGGGGQTIGLWDRQTGKKVWVVEGFAADSVAFSPDGRYIASGEFLGTRLWDVETSREVRRYNDGDAVKSVAFSPDGRYIASSGYQVTRIWDVETGNKMQGLEGCAGTVAFSAAGRYVLTGSSDKTARLWDLKTGKELRKLEGHTNWVSAVAFSQEDRYMVTGSRDGTTRFWDAATGKELASMIAFQDGTWAVVDPGDRYDASNGGDVEGLHWVVGNEPIALNQLKERYYEPGLLAKVMGFNKEPLRDVQAFNQVALYPGIEIRKPEGEMAKFDITLTNRGGGIGKVVVFINGKEIAADARGDKVKADAKTAELSVDIKNHRYLIPGKKNRIEVKAYNAEGYLSSRGVGLDYDAPGIALSEIPTLWAIVSGVSDYSGDAIDLRFAAKDARDAATALQLGGSRLFGTDRVKLQTLTTLAPDKQPTKDNLRQAFKELQAAKPGDIIVVYLSGHGVARGDEYYYLTQEARSADLTDPAVRERVAISSAELVEWVKQSPATGKQVMVLDTCAAGTFEKKLSETRDISSEQVRALDRMKDRTGFHVLMGSAADRVSYEATQYEQGLLTYALLEGMKGAALREQEYVDVSTLFNHAVNEVPRLAQNIGGIQSPRIAAPKGTSFDIGQLIAVDRQKIPLAQSKPFLLPPLLLNPGEGFDNLGLTALVRKKLREDSYASGRGEARRLPVVYVDAEQFAGALLPSGTYTVAGDKVQATVVLVRDQKRLTDLHVEGNAKDLEALSSTIVERIMATIERLK